MSNSFPPQNKLSSLELSVTYKICFFSCILSAHQRKEFLCMSRLQDQIHITLLCWLLALLKPWQEEKYVIFHRNESKRSERRKNHLTLSLLLNHHNIKICQRST